MAEDIAERRDEVRSLPLRIALCPSTYCNYNCIMCDHGRSPRRELPVEIWNELPRFLPTLQSLTLLGGEPLANPLAMKFLRAFDVAKYPDAAIDFVTNGSLLTATTLKTLKRCTLGDVTISVNAGTAEVYAKVQRGVAFETLLENLDNLIRFRSQHHRWFGITLSFVVQPAAAHTLIPFAEIAHARGLRIRLMALNPENHEGLDYYVDPDVVAGVVRELDRLIEYATRVEPQWLPEIRAARSATIEEAAARQNGRPLIPVEAREKSLPATTRRLPVV
jgi:molybdenum cofactor biosynthesis enzyme MoaA